MLRTLLPRRTRTLCLWIAALLSVPACGDPDTGKNPKSPPSGGGAASSFSAELALSDTPQVVDFGDELRVIVPGGALARPSRIHISPVSEPPTPGFACYAAKATYDVRIEGQESFDADLRIEVPIAPGELREDLPPELQFSAAYFVPAESLWVELPCEVDTAAQVLRIRTRHLCILQVWYLGVDYLMLGGGPGNDMAFFYNRSEVQKATPKYVAVHPVTVAGVPPFVSDVKEFAILALKRYRQAGFDLHTKPLRIMVTGSGSSSHSTLTNRVYITFEECKSSILPYVVAHEMFHNIQMNEYSLPGMIMRRWWTEVTAEYAASRVALENYVYMGKRNMAEMPARFLDTTLTHAPTPRPDWWKWVAGSDSNPYHAYQTAWFLERVVRRGAEMQRASGVAMSEAQYFHRLYQAVAGGGMESLPSLDAFLTGLHGADQGLRRQYERFALWYLFDPASPVPPSVQGREKFNVEALEDYQVLAGDASELQAHTFRLPEGYSAAAWMACLGTGQEGAERRLQVSIEGRLPEAMSVLVCKLPGLKRVADLAPVGAFRAAADAAQPITVPLGSGDGLCVVAVNGGFMPQAVTVKVRVDPGTTVLPVLHKTGSFRITTVAGKPGAREWEKEVRTYDIGSVVWDGVNFKAGSSSELVSLTGRVSPDGLVLLQASLTRTDRQGEDYWTRTKLVIEGVPIRPDLVPVAGRPSPFYPGFPAVDYVAAGTAARKALVTGTMEQRQVDGPSFDSKVLSAAHVRLNAAWTDDLEITLEVHFQR